MEEKKDPIKGLQKEMLIELTSFFENKRIDPVTATVICFDFMVVMLMQFENTEGSKNFISGLKEVITVIEKARN